jgi:hypothetical protein
MKGDMSKMCMGGMCTKCHAWKWLVLGVIVLINAYWPFLSWDKLIGILLVLGGLIKLVMPACSHCK